MATASGSDGGGESSSQTGWIAVNPKSDCPHVEGHSKADACSPLSDLTRVGKTFKLDTDLSKAELLDHIRGALYGNCIGDAIGLLTEFMTKREAMTIYGGKKKLMHSSRLPKLEYDLKHHDGHRSRWEIGDWTDDSDQMILILQSLLDKNGEVDVHDFAARFRVWVSRGFKELGDYGGMGIGRTTLSVLLHRFFDDDPHKAAREVWESSGKYLAPNGGVMRTSVLGIQGFGDMDTVIDNTKKICCVTHADPRCIASCVAVTSAIALMLQGKHRNKTGEFDADSLTEEAYNHASKCLEEKEQQEELKKHMFAESLHELRLDEEGKIGYTFKCLGAGFWSFRQSDFRKALTAVVMEAGDADTNGAVAGALLGCKLGQRCFPQTWLGGLCHKDWLDGYIDRYLTMLGLQAGE